jgi:hypothetical protein
MPICHGKTKAHCQCLNLNTSMKDDFSRNFKPILKGSHIKYHISQIQPDLITSKAPRREMKTRGF